MRLKNHLAIGFLMGAWINGINLIHPSLTQVQVAAMSAVLVGSVAPDIDMALNGFAKKPFRERDMLSHRGITHHILLPLVLFLLGLMQAGWERLLWIEFAIGVASHILMDLFSPLGVPYALSYQKRLRIPLYRTGEISEMLFTVAVSMAMLVLTVWR